MLNLLIDLRIEQGTVTNQMLVWNTTTNQFEVSQSLSGLTLNSPVIVDDFSWTGNNTTLDISDGRKKIHINNGGLSVFAVSDESLFVLSPVFNTIEFGNTTNDPTLELLGTGLTTLGGALDVAGKILANGGFIGDTDDDELIEIDGAGGIVTVNGDLGVDSLASSVLTVPRMNPGTLSVKPDNVSLFDTWVGSGSEDGAKLVLNHVVEGKTGEIFIDAFGRFIICSPADSVRLTGAEGVNIENINFLDASIIATGAIIEIRPNNGQTDLGRVLFTPTANTNISFTGNEDAGTYVADFASYGIRTSGNTRLGDAVTPTERLEVVGNAVATGDVSGATLTAGDGFTGTGAYTNFTIVAGIITAAS